MEITAALNFNVRKRFNELTNPVFSFTKLASSHVILPALTIAVTRHRLLLFDSVFTLLIRIKNGQNIFKPHKMHLYQRLNQAGIDQEKITIIYCFSILFLSIDPVYNNIYVGGYVKINI